MSGPIPDQPIRFPVQFQTWQHLAFLHWPYDVATVQRLVPDGLTVQEWGGITWVGITPFRMADVRLPALPPPPGWGAFPELNVRVYVRRPDGTDGIWFLGMLVPRRTFIAAAGSLGLPYQRSHSSMSVIGSNWNYRFSTPHWLGSQADDWFHAAVEVGRPLEATERTPLIESITGRWSAYHRRLRVLWRTPIAHEPWPLHAATASGNLTAPLRWAGLPSPTDDPLVHAASAVHTRFGISRPA